MFHMRHTNGITNPFETSISRARAIEIRSDRRHRRYRFRDELRKRDGMCGDDDCFGGSFNLAAERVAQRGIVWPMKSK